MSTDPTVKHILSLGAGVQSTTVALQFATGYYDQKLDAAIFADTQAEPRSVYRHLEWLIGEIARSPYPFPVHIVSAGSLERQSVTLRISKKTGNTYVRSLIPAFVIKQDGKRALMSRRCTAEFKVRQILKKARRIAEVPRGCKTVRVVQYIGISLDEAHRMKPSTEAWAENRWPLVDVLMTRDDCFDWMKAHGYPRPPRSACVFCPFHSDKEWLRLMRDEPDEFQRAVDFEREMRRVNKLTTGTARIRGDIYLHGSGKPLQEVEFTDAEKVDAFGNDCTGLCGV